MVPTQKGKRSDNAAWRTHLFNAMINEVVPTLLQYIYVRWTMETVNRIKKTASEMHVAPRIS